MAFRPGLNDLPEQSLEAAHKAITLVEDFTGFETELPDINAIEVAEYFTLNQAKTEDITMKEDLGRNFLIFENDLHVFDGSMSFCVDNSVLSGVSNLTDQFVADGFGDEDGGGILDFIISGDDEDYITKYSSEMNTSDVPFFLTHEKSPVVDKHAYDESEDSVPAINESTLLFNEELSLKPVKLSTPSEKKNRKRKRNLLIDSSMQLSSSAIQKQLSDFSDIITWLDFAPPTKSLMKWNKAGTANKLLSKPTFGLMNKKLLKLFPSSTTIDNLMSHGSEEKENKRHQESNENGTLLIEEASRLEESVMDRTRSELQSPSDTLIHHNRSWQNDDKEMETTILNMASYDILSIDSARRESEVDQAESNFENESNPDNTIDNREIHLNKRAHQFLSILQKHSQSGNTTFCLQELCKHNNRKQAAEKFICLLALKKQGAINVTQLKPYNDILATPGSNFYKI
ncbi:double-strand-break repair protein rad21 homolog [Polypterus senegalus]|uniref:double-strand-break repair protein rad21 homolog n=1 Tax=Polypterus senegalus TaxID=55291 RepID=UPI001964D358|nr:double-strand-break repair protein rad21 homolog [Polypterus senegalus]